ncbi:MAG: glutathione S-transferase N-terminal domain-containing protein [Roseobacter sp.]
MSFSLYNYVLSGNCYKIRLMAALLGVTYKTIPVDFYPGHAHKSPLMLSLNPAGTLPVLTSGDMILTETQAMLCWIATQYDPTGAWFPKDNPLEMAQVIEWLGFSAQLTQSVGAARLHAMLNWPLDVDAARATAIKDMRTLEIHLSDRVLDGKKWIVGDQPTIADIACFPYIALSPDAGMEHDEYPAIRNWLYGVRGLPGFVAMPGIHYLHELNETPDD